MYGRGWKRHKSYNEKLAIRDRWHSRQARRRRKVRVMNLRKIGRKGRK